MLAAGLDIKDPKNCNRFPPLGGIKWHRVVLDVRPAHLPSPGRNACVLMQRMWQASSACSRPHKRLLGCVRSPCGPRHAGVPHNQGRSLAADQGMHRPGQRAALVRSHVLSAFLRVKML